MRGDSNEQVVMLFANQGRCRDNLQHQEVRKMPESSRLVLVLLEVADVDRSAALYRDAFGINLHPGTDNDMEGNGEMEGDRWLAGRHAAYSWHEGAYLHFALYQAKSTQTTTQAQIGFMVQDLGSAHARAVKAGATVLHPARPEPWGATARYLDYDGNIVSLTQGP
jgi:predicted enzyme related to lactoylglutathione lyase